MISSSLDEERLEAGHQSVLQDDSRDPKDLKIDRASLQSPSDRNKVPLCVGRCATRLIGVRPHALVSR